LTLDTSRAFDRVEYNNLFQLLIDRNACPLYARLLINMHTLLKLRVRRNRKCNEVFSVCNGVKQGGMLSLFLFYIYFDALLERLKQASGGCFIGNTIVGCMVSCRAKICLFSICEQLGLE